MKEGTQRKLQLAQEDGILFLRPEKRRSEYRSNPPRILFVGESIALAHVGRPALLAYWARLAGYKTFFACGNSYTHAARSYGIKPIELETIDPKVFFKRHLQGRFMYSGRELDSYVAEERKLIRRIQPDLIVSDFRLTLAISARLERVPLLSLTHAYWNPNASFKLPALRGGLWESIPDRMRGRLFECVQPLALRYFAANLDATRKRHGLKPKRDFRQNYTDGEYCAYLDLPELGPDAVLPPGHFYLGPIFWTPRHTSGISPQDMSSSRKLAYVTLGSTGYAPVLPKVLHALLASDWDAVVSGCHVPAGEVWKHLPKEARSRVRFTKTINPSQILSSATITVCHGGHGSVYQSLSAGVPVLCLPSNPDQELVTQSVIKAGGGVGMSAHSVTIQRITEKIKQTLYCQKIATRLKQAIQAFHSQTRWNRWLNHNLPRQKRTRLQKENSQCPTPAYPSPKTSSR